MNQILDPSLASPSAAAETSSAGAVYDAPTRALHWLSAALVLLLWGTAQLWDLFPRGSAGRHALQDFHVSAGLLFIALLAFRLLWRFTAGRHLAPPGPTLLALAARIGHGALYALMLALAVTGPLNRALRGDPLGFFGLFTLPSPVAANRDLVHPVNEVHGTLGNALLILAALHALAALYHQFIRHDGTLGRMIPALARRKTETV
jgi:cytochrome b561